MINNFIDFEIESAGTYKDLLEGKLYVGTATAPTLATTTTTTTIEYNASTANTLYVAIEDFTDDDPIPATVTKVDYTLKGVDGSAFYATSSAPATFEATFDLSTIPAGDYTLFAEAKLTSGYVVTTQIQLLIK
jgi:ABC-type Zn2+ transport system substrate-binding protein/surface adhesin